MRERAIFTTANGETIEGIIDGEHSDCRDGEVLFVVDGRGRRADDLPPGKLAVTVQHRTIRAMALVQRARSAGFDVWLDCGNPPDSRRDKRRWH